MCTVKAGGIAEEAGLQVGDQILDMNGTSFHDLKLNEAVALMKSAKDIRLTVKKGAGISLFLDNNSTSQLSNKNEDTISTSRSISDGLSATLKDQDFSSGSCSSKSEGGSSFQSSVSSDSEKDYSISEESSEGGGGKQNPQWHKKQSSMSSSASSQPMDDEAQWSSRRKDDAWIEEEKRHLEEDRRRLEEEKRRLEEERKKLELERSASAMSSTILAPPPPPSISSELDCKDNSFLNELQKVAARMNSSDGRLENGNGTLIKPKEPVFKGKRGKEDAIKRMQHEMLMEEFREAHRKMFGQHSLLTVDENAQNGNSLQHIPNREVVDCKQPLSLDSSKILSNTKPKQPPPIPFKNVDNNKKECQKTTITINGQVPSHQSQTPNIQSQTPRIRQAIPAVKVAAPPTETPKSTVTNGFRVTVTPGRSFDNAPKAKSGTLVEVTPWTTRL
ncbi:hypothetical protein JTE90_014460 [Oedothorax gibbosus]|uniref:PDZ domain-containing protein n=1 Tax=Oedothorax gibbosus TaxID=931172 RepID=A0AAV6VJ20_9ARAC|nr:hypothetical protein JTE90_014460 [Oedothorax gibbosus]